MLADVRSLVDLAAMAFEADAEDAAEGGGPSAAPKKSRKSGAE